MESAKGPPSTSQGLSPSRKHLLGRVPLLRSDDLCWDSEEELFQLIEGGRWSTERPDREGYWWVLPPELDEPEMAFIFQVDDEDAGLELEVAWFLTEVTSRDFPEGTLFSPVERHPKVPSRR